MQTFIRVANCEDIVSIIQIQKIIYPSRFIIEKDILLDIISINMSLVVLDIKTNVVLGYLLAYPSSLDYIQPINKTPNLFKRLDVIFIHDLCILPKFQETTIGSNLFKYFREKYKSSIIQLVSKNASFYFWKKMGFYHKTLVKISKEYIKSYGYDDIYFMECL